MAAAMEWTLEVVVVPVSDVDRAKTFYAEQLGFNVDHDMRRRQRLRRIPRSNRRTPMS